MCCMMKVKGLTHPLQVTNDHFVTHITGVAAPFVSLLRPPHSDWCNSWLITLINGGKKHWTNSWNVPRFFVLPSTLCVTIGRGYKKKKNQYSKKIYSLTMSMERDIKAKWSTRVRCEKALIWREAASSDCRSLTLLRLSSICSAGFSTVSSHLDTSVTSRPYTAGRPSPGPGPTQTRTGRPVQPLLSCTNDNIHPF